MRKPRMTEENAMWFVAHLLTNRSSSSFLALASYRFRRWLRMMIETITNWSRRARDRDELRRYLHYELRNAPNDLPAAARIESEKPFWEV
jgi:alpha-beta hydrolase superfamily lysophospholipase